MAQGNDPRAAGLLECDAPGTRASSLEAELAGLKDRFDFLGLIFQDDRLAAYDWHLTSGEISFDAHLESLLGYASGEVASQIEPWRELLHPEDRERIGAAARDYLEGRAALFDADYRVRHKNGEWLWVRDRCRVVSRDDQGRPLCVRGALRDISPRKRTEDALRASQERYRRITEAVTDYIYTVRIQDGRVVETRHGPGCVAVTGHTTEELAADPYLWYRMVAEDDRPAVEAQARRLLAGESMPPLEHRLLRKDGAVRWVRNTPVLHHDAHGRFVAYDGLIQDITEQRSAEDALRRSEQRYRLLFDSITDVLLVHRVGPDLMPGRLLEVNDVACRVFGLSRDELLALSPVDLEGPEARADAPAIVARMMAGEVVSFERTATTREGRHVPFEIHSRVFDLEGRPAIISLARDITERKRAEEALRDSEELYRTLAETSPDMIFVVDREGYIRYVNSVAARQFSASADALLGRRLDEVYDPQTAQQHMDAILEVIRSGKTLYHETVDHLPGGSRWIDAHLSPVQNRAGEIVAVQGVSRDITERRRAEEALRESEERYHQLFELESDAIVLVDSQTGQILEVNAAAVELYGYSREEWLRMGHTDVSAEPDQTRRAALEHHTRVPVRWHRKKDGTVFPVEITGRHFERQGRSVHVAAIRDITERKLAEENLAAERERLAVTLASIGDGVIATDTEGCVRIVNRAAEQLTGWSQREAIGRPLDEVFQLMDQTTRQPCEGPARKVLATGGVVDLGSHLLPVGEAGTARLIAHSAAPIRDAHGQIIGVVVAFHDVTEKQRLEQQLRQTQKLESIALLAGGIAHDFNNILTGILGNVSLARSLVAEEGKASERLIEAERAALRAQDLTQQLLTFSKGGAPIRRPARLEPLVREAVTFALRGSSVGVEFALAEGLWPAEVDPGQVNQALGNIVLNAVQAMPTGGTLRVRAENTVLELGNPFSLAAGEYVAIAVTDTGIGMSASLLSRIFDPFFTTKQKGNGLGLTTTYSIVQGHHGHVAVESQLGLGSTFTVYLPATTKAIEEREQTEAPLRAGQGRVLVMDDEPMVRDLAAEILTSNGYTVECARDGCEAVEIFRRATLAGAPFDAVIMDLTVAGGMGGREALPHLREIDPHVRAIVSSGYSNDPIMANYHEHGFRAVLVKPYTVTLLLTSLHEALRPAAGPASGASR
jgi:PAS domain S-box-containing protein